MKWISVKDRLPEGVWSKQHPTLSEEVLIVNSCAILVGYYDRHNEIWYTGGDVGNEWVDKITHWMPLPKNPHKGGVK